MAKSLGKPLMPWQAHVVDVAMEVRPDGTLHYDRVVLTVPRQSGKTTLILPVFVHRSVAELPGGRLDVGPQKQTVAYTAQTRNDARKKWIKEFIPLLERSPFRHHFEKRLTNGSEGFDWVNGSTFDLVATMEKSGHGDTLDLGIIDEAFAQVDDRLEQALEPATMTRTASQLWIVSTAGENAIKSPFLWAQVESGRRQCELGTGSRTAYFEWSVGDDEDANDIDVVAARHPAVGHTITVEDLQAKLDQALLRDELSGFRRAYCNMWGAEEAMREPKLPQTEWADSTSPTVRSINSGEITLVYDVDIDARTTSIGVGHGSISEPYVELIEHKAGVGWLPERIVELVKKWEPIALACNGAGPAGAQVDAVQQALRDADLDIEIQEFTATDYQRACGGFFADVSEGRLSRFEGQGPLDAAGADATHRALGESWAWDRRNATVPISPLVAVTIARALLPTEIPEQATEPGFLVM